MPTMRVHLADAHTMFREGLAAILASHDGVEVVGQTWTGEKAADAVWRLQPDVVVMQLDVRLKEADKILHGIRSASPRSRVVVLALWDDPRYMRAVSEMGIDALLHKSSSADELIAAIDGAVLAPDGENAVVSLPRAHLRRLGRGLVGGLTERESDVVVLASRGLSNAGMAEALSISVATVKRHLSNIYEKLGVGSRTEIVRMAIAEGWIGLHDITGTGADGRGRK